MKDILGNKIKVGDRVHFIKWDDSFKIFIGSISRIESNNVACITFDDKIDSLPSDYFSPNQILKEGVDLRGLEGFFKCMECSESYTTVLSFDFENNDKSTADFLKVWVGHHNDGSDCGWDEGIVFLVGVNMAG